MMRIAALAVVLVLAAGAVQAQERACPAGDLVPYVSAGGAPKVSVLEGSELEGWQPPACAGWPTEAHAKLVVTLTGTFRFGGSMDALLARVGEISQLPAIPYWSARDKKWEMLAKDASALNSPAAADRREDFSPADFKPGAELYYWQNDALTGGTVYALTVYENTPERVVIGTDNVTAVRKSIFSLFAPGASRSALILERVGPGLFEASIVASAMQGASSLVKGHDDIYVNRARALFDFLAANRPDEAQVALDR